LFDGAAPVGGKVDGASAEQEIVDQVNGGQSADRRTDCFPERHPRHVSSKAEYRPLVVLPRLIWVGGHGALLVVRRRHRDHGLRPKEVSQRRLNRCKKLRIARFDMGAADRGFTSCRPKIGCMSWPDRPAAQALNTWRRM
jgi:hypothetical protein